MSGFFSSATVKSALVTGIASLIAAVPSTVIAVVDDHPPNVSCVKVDDAALRFVAAHQKLRAIYAAPGDASKTGWHLSPLASDEEMKACGNPERLVEIESLPIPKPTAAP